MTRKKLHVIYCAIFIAISFPFTIIHLMANPDDAPITPIQHIVAALSNFFGPWGVAIVRLVDFPNAGLRAFTWTEAITLTLIGILIMVLPNLTKNQFFHYLLVVFWVLFSMIWFTIGLRQIAHGLL